MQLKFEFQGCMKSLSVNNDGALFKSQQKYYNIGIWELNQLKREKRNIYMDAIGDAARQNYLNNSNWLIKVFGKIKSLEYFWKKDQLCDHSA